MWSLDYPARRQACNRMAEADQVWRSSLRHICFWKSHYFLGSINRLPPMLLSGTTSIGTVIVLLNKRATPGFNLFSNSASVVEGLL